MNPRPQEHQDVGHAFPFVPQLFLAVLLSSYSIDALQAASSLVVFLPCDGRSERFLNGEVAQLRIEGLNKHAVPSLYICI